MSKDSNNPQKHNDDLERDTSGGVEGDEDEFVTGYSGSDGAGEYDLDKVDQDHPASSPSPSADTVAWTYKGGNSR